MPLPSEILNDWSRAIGGLTRELDGPNGADMASYLAKDIGIFNKILASEATRLGVELPANGFPDPKSVADRIVRYTKMLNTATKENM